MIHTSENKNQLLFWLADLFCVCCSVHQLVLVIHSVSPLKYWHCLTSAFLTLSSSVKLQKGSCSHLVLQVWRGDETLLLSGSGGGRGLQRLESQAGEPSWAGGLQGPGAETFSTTEETRGWRGETAGGGRWGGGTGARTKKQVPRTFTKISREGLWCWGHSWYIIIKSTPFFQIHKFILIFW